MEHNTIIASKFNNTGIITINHAENKETIGIDTLKEIYMQIDEWENNSSIKAVIIRGKESFVSGIDLNELKNFDIDLAHKYIDNISNCSLVTIAAVNDSVIGIGLELALACDLIISTDNTKFAYPETSLNILPCLGGIHRLTQAAGKAKTTEMILTGRVMYAEEAEKAGIVTRIVPLRNLVEDSLKTANLITERDKEVLKSAKQIINSVFANASNTIAAELSAGKLYLNNFKKDN